MKKKPLLSLNSRSLTALLLVNIVVFPAFSGEVTETEQGLVFTENFSWEGNHAASILNGTSTTVWWDEASWDVRGDTSYTAVAVQSSTINNRFHIDVHKAETDLPTDGRLSNTEFIIGGNGTAGVGVMHLDFQDILSARLRNPLLVSEQIPGVIEFYATDFVTSGHWWEIAISPSDKIIGAENSGVPGQEDSALPGATIGSGGQVGPGHDSPEDSINLVSFGATDVPCITGWWTRFGLTRTVDQQTTYVVNQVPALQDLMAVDPADADVLRHWKMEVKPTSIELYLDEKDDDQFTLVESWSINVPWPEVFVHFMAVAYQADHHPQGDCFLGHIRELKWRDISVYPVRYHKTDVYPKNQGVVTVGRDEGWMDYEIRDIQRFGPPVNGAPQPNTVAFDTSHSGRYCNDAGFPCFNNISSVNLSLQVPNTSTPMSLSKATLITDHKRSYNDFELPVSITLDGQGVGAFQPASESAGVDAGTWIRRGVDVPVGALQPGAVHDLVLSLGTGSYLDRMEVEYYYESDTNVIDLIFADSFE